MQGWTKQGLHVSCLHINRAEHVQLSLVRPVNMEVRVDVIYCRARDCILKGLTHTHTVSVLFDFWEGSIDRHLLLNLWPIHSCYVSSLKHGSLTSPPINNCFPYGGWQTPGKPVSQVAIFPVGFYSCQDPTRQRKQRSHIMRTLTNIK